MKKKKKSTYQLTNYLGPGLSYHLFLFRSCQYEKNIIWYKFDSNQGTGKTIIIINIVKHLNYDHFAKLLQDIYLGRH